MARRNADRCFAFSVALNFEIFRSLNRVSRADGPERIFGEWWKHAAETAAVRDYFQVENDAGERFWIYRAGDGEDGATGAAATGTATAADAEGARTVVAGSTGSIAGGGVRAVRPSSSLAIVTGCGPDRLGLLGESERIPSSRRSSDSPPLDASRMR